MNLPTWKFIFVATYLLVDLVYIYLSRSIYVATTNRIQGNNSGFAARPLGALLAYVSLIVGWVLLAVPWIESRIRSEAKISVVTALGYGLAGGLLYGLTVYGVFNGTLYAMFRGYDIGIVVRDLAWGLTSASILSVAYAGVYYNVSRPAS